jgi:SAM-dependent methyltransferase
MPSSDANNIPPILAVAQNFRPASILDVGCGWGKYGFLLREYLDVQSGRLQPGEWRTRIVGIEVFPAYRTPVWDYVYNEVRIGNAEELLPSMGQFDMITMIDVIEHLPRDSAEALVARALHQCRLLVVSTPAAWMEQGALYGNAHEEHRILFNTGNFPRSAHVAVLPCKVCNVYVASLNPIPIRLLPGRAYWRGLTLFQKMTWLIRRALGIEGVR